MPTWEDPFICEEQAQLLRNGRYQHVLSNYQRPQSPRQNDSDVIAAQQAYASARAEFARLRDSNSELSSALKRTPTPHPSRSRAVRGSIGPGTKRPSRLLDSNNLHVLDDYQAGSDGAAAVSSHNLVASNSLIQKDSFEPAPRNDFDQPSGPLLPGDMCEATSDSESFSIELWPSSPNESTMREEQTVRTSRENDGRASIGRQSSLRNIERRLHQQDEQVTENFLRCPRHENHNMGERIRRIPCTYRVVLWRSHVNHGKGFSDASTTCWYCKRPLGCPNVPLPRGFAPVRENTSCCVIL